MSIGQVLCKPLQLCANVVQCSEKTGVIHPIKSFRRIKKYRVDMLPLITGPMPAFQDRQKLPLCRPTTEESEPTVRNVVVGQTIRQKLVVDQTLQELRKAAEKSDWAIGGRLTEVLPWFWYRSQNRFFPGDVVCLSVCSLYLRKRLNQAAKAIFSACSSAYFRSAGLIGRAGFRKPIYWEIMLLWQRF